MWRFNSVAACCFVHNRRGYRVCDLCEPLFGRLQTSKAAVSTCGARFCLNCQEPLELLFMALVKTVSKVSSVLFENGNLFLDAV